jgi:hypothetical protein
MHAFLTQLGHCQKWRSPKLSTAKTYDSRHTLVRTSGQRYFNWIKWRRGLLIGLPRSNVTPSVDVDGSGIPKAFEFRVAGLRRHARTKFTMDQSQWNRLRNLWKDASLVRFDILIVSNRSFFSSWSPCVFLAIGRYPGTESTEQLTNTIQLNWIPKCCASEGMDLLGRFALPLRHITDSMTRFLLLFCWQHGGWQIPLVPEGSTPLARQQFNVRKALLQQGKIQGMIIATTLERAW